MSRQALNRSEKRLSRQLLLNPFLNLANLMGDAKLPDPDHPWQDEERYKSFLGEFCIRLGKLPTSHHQKWGLLSKTEPDRLRLYRSFYKTFFQIHHLFESLAAYGMIEDVSNRTGLVAVKVDLPAFLSVSIDMRGHLKPTASWGWIGTLVNALEDVRAVYIRKCLECSDFFFGFRNDQKCCTIQHANLYRVKKFLKGGDYAIRSEMRKEKKLAKERKKLKAGKTVHVNDMSKTRNKLR